MIDIGIDNFQTELIQASMAQPVLLDIWAPWCAPCKALGPVLEKLETEFAGRFRLAKLNSDEQPEISGQLSQMFGVRSIPFCVMFVGGQPVDGFVGALPESQIRSFLDKHVPSESELEAQAEVEEAETLAEEGDTDAALAKLQQAVAVDPANDGARFDYLKMLLELGRVDDARRAFEPVASKTLLDQRLAAIAAWIAAFDAAAQAPSEAALQEAIAANRRDFAARFALAQRHFAAQRFTQALDELLEILMRDKAWSEGLARKHYVSILELMTKPAPKPATGAAAKGTLEVVGAAAPSGEDSVVDRYRRKLSMAIF